MKKAAIGSLIAMLFFSASSFVLGFVDTVVFSYDRPLQLYALLESMEKYISHMGRVTVVYRASDFAYRDAYSDVRKSFPFAQFVIQGANPTQDFKQLAIKASHFDEDPEFVMYAVDDIIVKDYVDFSECVNGLRLTGAYGFYLRLGTNLTDGYPPGVPQKKPSFSFVSESILSWVFNQSEGDWAYPHTVDMTIYRKNDVVPHILEMNYRAPNILEAEWSGRSASIMAKKGVCFEKSKIVNIPMNIVQDCGWQNPHMHFKNALELLRIFNEGKKIDISKLYQVDNRGSHWDYVPQFIDRIKR